MNECVYVYVYIYNVLMYVCVYRNGGNKSPPLLTVAAATWSKRKRRLSCHTKVVQQTAKRC